MVSRRGGRLRMRAKRGWDDPSSFVTSPLPPFLSAGADAVLRVAFCLLRDATCSGSCRFRRSQRRQGAQDEVWQVPGSDRSFHHFAALAHRHAAGSGWREGASWLGLASSVRGVWGREGIWEGRKEGRIEDGWVEGRMGGGRQGGREGRMAGEYEGRHER